MNKPFFEISPYFLIKILLAATFIFAEMKAFAQTRYSFPKDFEEAKSIVLAKDSIFRDSLSTLEPALFSKRILRSRGYRITGSPYKDKRYTVKAANRVAGVHRSGRSKIKVALRNDKVGPSKITFYKVVKRDEQVIKMILLEALPEIYPAYEKPAYIRFEFSMGEVVRVTTLNFRLQPLSMRIYLKYK